MNDRLADLGNDLPAWAQEDDTNNDIEQANLENISPNPTSTSTSGRDGGGASIASWAKDDWSSDDFHPASEDTVDAKSQTLMKQFFADVESIKTNIESITNATERIGEMNQEAFVAMSSAQEEELSKDMRALVNKTNKEAKDTKNLLELLKEDNGKYKEDGTINTSDMRVRENLCNTYTRKFIDEMKLYQQAQQKYKTDIQTKAERQIRHINPDATDEEVDTIMRSEGGRESQFQQSFLSGGVNDSIKQAYTNVAGKYQDVIALEQSVAELHQMFLDFALLTEQQGELIDQIEHNVTSAADYVEEGNIEFHKGLEYQKSIRKKQCWIILIVVILTIVMLFALKILPWFGFYMDINLTLQQRRDMKRWWDSIYIPSM